MTAQEEIRLRTHLQASAIALVSLGSALLSVLLCLIDLDSDTFARIRLTTEAGSIVFVVVQLVWRLVVRDTDHQGTP